MVDIQYQSTSFVYGIRSLDLIKVGVAKDIQQRLDTMRLHNPHGCELVFYRTTHAPYIFEKRMHELLADKAVGREWFRVTTGELRKAASIARVDAARAKRAVERKGSRWLEKNGHPSDTPVVYNNDINGLDGNACPI